MPPVLEILQKKDTAGNYIKGSPLCCFPGLVNKRSLCRCKWPSHLFLECTELSSLPPLRPLASHWLLRNTGLATMVCANLTWIPECTIGAVRIWLLKLHPEGHLQYNSLSTMQHGLHGELRPRAFLCRSWGTFLCTAFVWLQLSFRGTADVPSLVFPAGSLTGVVFAGIYRVCFVDVESQARFRRCIFRLFQVQHSVFRFVCRWVAWDHIQERT